MSSVAPTQEPPSEEALFSRGDCPLCGHSKSSRKYPIDQGHAEFLSGYSVKEDDPGVDVCVNCGHNFIQPVPNPVFLKAFYASYMVQAKDNFYKDRQAQAEIPETFRRRYSRWLDLIQENGIDGGKLLDIGAGLGMFLRLARERNFKVAGVEPNDDAVQSLRDTFGIDVHNCMLEEVSTDETYDVVTMWDLLEHLANPTTSIQKVRSLLRPGGMVMMEIPARDSFIHNFATKAFTLTGGAVKKPVNLVYGVHHLQYFTSKSIRSFLESQGFEVLAVKRDETELHALHRPVVGSAAQKMKTRLFNGGIASAFAVARMLQYQNKLVVLAKRS